MMEIFCKNIELELLIIFEKRFYYRYLEDPKKASFTLSSGGF